jgi:methylglyoxal synthase
MGSRIAEGKIDIMIFFSDPLESQPHDPDVKALLRIASVYDIPVANNRATADFLITSRFMNSEYEHPLLDFTKITEVRAEAMYNDITAPDDTADTEPPENEEKTDARERASEEVA